MADKWQVGVRYCGGCNPRYDRVALVKRLEGLLPDACFVPARPGTPYPAVVVACGCPSRCANVSDLAVPAGKLVYLSGWEELLPAKKQLEELGRSQDGGQTRSLTHEEVLAVLPHRPPMLFIDTVERLTPGAEIQAFFFASPDLPAFAGHFPGAPVLPGVYTVEAAAQACDIMMMTTQRYAGKLPLFAGVRQAGFHSRVLPGDTLDIHAALLEERPGMGAVTCRAQVFARGELAADMDLRLVFR